MTLDQNTFSVVGMKPGLYAVMAQTIRGNVERARLAITN